MTGFLRTLVCLLADAWQVEAKCAIIAFTLYGKERSTIITCAFMHGVQKPKLYNQTE
jgi:hypothetical protein